MKFASESEDLSSDNYSEPISPERKNSADYQRQQEEINRKYNELLEQLNHEFDLKREEWKKIRSVCGTSVSSGIVCCSDYVVSGKY